MAHKKAGGSTKNLRDSAGKRLGVKAFGGEMVKSGMIIVRQRGTKYTPSTGVGLGRDHTIYATMPGKVKFFEKRLLKFNGQHHKETFVSVEAS